MLISNFTNTKPLLLGVILALLPWYLVCDQSFDIISSCTSYKQSLFEEKVEFGYLSTNLHIKPIILDKCRSYTPIIGNGLPAEPKEFPSMARLGHRSVEPPSIKWLCGGTLISQRYVLTAAHCLLSENEPNVVRLGELDFASDSEDAMPQDYTIENYILHPNYTALNYVHKDIALIKLAEDVKFDRYKHPACLPIEDGTGIDAFIAIGWGSTGFTRIGTTKLAKVKLERYPDESCRKNLADLEDFSQFDAKTQMCVGSHKGEGTCNGDSGGPILIYHKDYPCLYHVMGITSAGFKCGDAEIPSLFTRVHYFLDWIRQNISHK